MFKGKTEKIIFLFAAAVVCAVTFAACASVPLALDLQALDGRGCFVNEVFNVEPFIEKQEGVNYSLTAVNYDSDFEEHPLQTEGLTFTPLYKGDVEVTVTAARGEETLDTMVTLIANERTDVIDERMRATWADIGCTKTVITDPQYIRSDGYSSLRVNFIGVNPHDTIESPGMNFVQINDFHDVLSVTDWSNAVLKFSVFNPMAEDLTFSMRVVQLSQGIDEDFTLWREVAEPGKWTDFTLSYKDVYGLTQPIATGSHSATKEANFLKVIYGGRPGDGSMYSFNFYIDDLDIVNGN